MKNFLIIDINNDDLNENKLFDPEYAGKISHTLYPLCFLSQQAFKEGIECITPDVFLKNPSRYQGAFLMSHLISPNTRALIGAGAVPLIVYCQESPFIAARFYLNLKEYSGWFKYSILFSGMKLRVNKKAVFYTMRFPEFYEVGNIVPALFADKKMAALVSNAKGMRNWKKNLLLKLNYGWNIKEVNGERWKVIAFFSSAPRDFDLYGIGWDRPNNSRIEPGSLTRVFKGMLPYQKKIEVLKQYKFVFCFENSVFPGYVTEKIFDAMLGGSVPIYFGAPDITDFVPEKAFIDYRNFKSVKDLHVFLSAMDEETYNLYLRNIRDYLHSNLYQGFTQQAFAGQIIGLVKAQTSVD